MSLQESNEDIHAIMARAKAARARLRNLAQQPQRVVNVEAAPIVPRPPSSPVAHLAIMPSWATFNIRVDWAKDKKRAAVEHDVANTLPLARIKKICAEVLGVSLMDLSSNRRPKCIVTPRHLTWFMCKEFSNRSYPEIGRAFGGKDHTTVMHGVKQIEIKLPIDPDIQVMVGKLRHRLIRASREFNRGRPNSVTATWAAA
jgi:chromosomal replication initiator protein